MRPVVFALDHVCSITAAPAETPHETWFQQTYGSDIISALERLKNPTNPANPSSSWLPFKQVRSLYTYTICSSHYIFHLCCHLVLKLHRELGLFTLLQALCVSITEKYLC